MMVRMYAGSSRGRLTGGQLQMNELVFEVTEAAEGGYDARAVGHSIFTQGSDWTDLKEMVRDAVLCHFDDSDVPEEIRFLECADRTNA